MQSPIPIDIDIDRESAITIRWKDGTESRLPLTLLRKFCPCATCRARREELLVAEAHSSAPTGGRLPVLSHQATIAEMVTIADAELVGHYALRLKWADGHDTGIYDYSYLQSLGPGSESA